MATKDWKKVKPKFRREILRWKKDIWSQVYISKVDIKRTGDKYYSYIESAVPISEYYDKGHFFKTKTKALAYAKAYMRKH